MIDDIDRDILLLLERDGRLPFKDLAERVGLSANATAERVRKLHERGVIRGIVAEIDPAAFGRTLQALIEVKFEPSTTGAQFEAIAAATTGVVRALTTTGRFDMILEVVARDQQDLQRIIETLRSSGLTRDTYSRVIASDRRFTMATK